VVIRRGKWGWLAEDEAFLMKDSERVLAEDTTAKITTQWHTIKLVGEFFIKNIWSTKISKLQDVITIIDSIYHARSTTSVQNSGNCKLQVAVSRIRSINHFSICSMMEADFVTIS